MPLLLLLLLLSIGCRAQEDTTAAWPFQHVDKKSMLSNSAITSVYMDRYYYIWLGSWDGLDRYDGSSIKVYKPDPYTKGTISNNVIRKFLEDGDGNLWIITHQGINRYDRQKDLFHSYLDSLNDIPFLEYNIRACVGPDSAVWASFIGKGLSRYSKIGNTFLPLHFEGIDETWLSSVIDVGCDKGLFYLLGSDGKLICTLKNNIVFSKQLVDQGQLLFHQFVKIGQRYYVFITTGRGNLLLYNLSDIEATPSSLNLGKVQVTSVNESLDRASLWIGTESGSIFKIINTGKNFELHEMNSYFPAFAKSGIKILTITETLQNLIWVGTDGDGVYKFLTRPRMFYSISKGEPAAGQLSHSIVRSVYEDNTGKLYIGTRGGGLNIVDRNQDKTKVINTKNGLSNNAVLSLNMDHRGNLWVGLDGEGIDMVEAKTNRILHFPRDFENKTDLDFSSVYSICIDSFDDIWLGTSGYGIIHFKVAKTGGNRYRLVEYDQVSHSFTHDAISIRSNIVYSIVEEKPNILWFGTRGSGIYRYNSLTKKIEDQIQADSRQKIRLVNNDVLSLYIDQQEQLWVGTSGGLTRIFMQSKPFHVSQYTLREGLYNNTIHGIQEDKKNNIWVSTNHGLTVFDRGQNSFKNFDANDGLLNNEFADGANFQSRHSEKLFFGGIDGLDVVYPSKTSTLNYFPRLAVKEFLIHNIDITPNSGILENNIDLTTDISLSHDQNFISFSFTTLDYWSKQKSEYAYFLENFDKAWNYIGQQQSITLTNIPPGHYKLNINATNENGKWNSKPRTFSISIAPPFWKTTWAYLLYALCGLGLQVGIILYIRERARAKRALSMDRFKAQQLKELNDYKLQFFTNVAHEFRTPLTLILGPVTSLLNKITDADSKSQLKTIHNNSIRLQKLIEELIQFRKIESGKDELELSLTDLVPLTQQIVESFQEFAIEKDIHLEFHPEPESLQALIDLKKFEKILLNLVSNAIKYNSKGGIVTVTLKQENSQAIFQIRDEGLGIAEGNKDKIFESFYHNPSELMDGNGLAKSTGIGLSLTKSLVMIHRGEIHVESKLGKGSTFTVRLPITKESYRDIPEEKSLIMPVLNLSEKVLLEFEAEPLLTDMPEKASRAMANKNAYSLLVVDDSAQITSLLENILSNKYIIHKAHHGKRALTILEEEHVDLVISDILMPDMDGLTLCKTIKENIQTSHIPVILLTAKSEIENRIQGLQVGADSYIPKPFHPEHLFIRIEKLIERMELIRRKFQNSANLELPQVSGISDRDDLLFSKITQCIQNRLGETEFNADDIGDEVGMSKASLYRKVKTITGLTPHGLIKQYRLKKAADLLKNSSLTVSEVIYETGFNSRSYFYKSFNEMFHCHPKDFNALTASAESKKS